ncbi:MAG: shikimate kinase [Chthoniobacteraceae bacterium]
MLPRENIVLVGFMGSGKSAVGRLVAKRLRFRFVDTDQIIVDRAGMPIPDIFAQHGEEHFRDLESAALESQGNLRQCVISTGGGAVVKERNLPILKSLGFVVWLTASEEVIFDRVSRNDKRPLLQTANPRATIAQLLAVRRPLYENAADFSLDTTTLTHDAAAEAVIAAARQAFAWDAPT